MTSRRLHPHLGRWLVLLALMLVVATAGIAASACGGSESSDRGGGEGDITGATAATASGDALESGSIVVDGLVDYPMTLTVMDMDYMYWVTTTAQHPEQGATEYQGVMLNDVFSYIGARDGATTLVLTGADGTTAEVALADIGEDALLAVDDDDVMSTVMPGLDASAWVDDLVGMTFK